MSVVVCITIIPEVSRGLSTEVDVVYDHTNLAFADHAFSHAAPSVWNSLPLDSLRPVLPCNFQTTSKD